MNALTKCSCGGTFFPVEGLEGLFCDKCGAFLDTPAYASASASAVEKTYTEEKLKAVRGTPVNRFIIGSESKGRIEVSVPIFATKEEQKALIDQQLNLMQYMKSRIDELGLDIMPKR